MMGRVTRTDHAIGAALCALYVAVLLFTAPDLGLSRDESMYVAAAESYAHWFQLLAHDPAAAFTQSNIDRDFRVNHEHPPLAKSLFALSHLLDREFDLFPRESLAHRFPGMLCAGLLLWLIHVFGTRLYGRRAGLFAALAFALLPRPFYHAHLNAFDIPITLATTAVTYAYLRSLSQPRWALGCGALFGLALATKHNSWLLPGIFAVHFTVLVIFNRLRRQRGETHLPRLSPYWLAAMATLGPAIFFASWPWLWHDTRERLAAYAAFHLHHEYYNIAYFGVNYFWPPFPISYPWVMTLYTVPTTTLLLSVLGFGLRVRAEVGQSLSVLRPSREACPERDPLHTTTLLLGCLLAPLVIISLPSTPIFGGTKHWFTAYPFLALFAGVGFDRTLRACKALWPRATTWWWTRGPGTVVLAAWLLSPALVETIHSHPFGLSHYGFAAGFVPGAADRGMNRQFWGFTTGSLVDFFDTHLPGDGKVYACDTTDLAFRMLARDGLLSERIVPTRDIAGADYAIVHHELHMAEVDTQIWTTYGTTQPVYVLTYDGVPIISVYENPKHRAGRAQ
jgi:4-amino-4-deoxy-L-arabinose transferase-like glycosyltransferase